MLCIKNRILADTMISHPVFQALDGMIYTPVLFGPKEGVATT